MLDQLILSAMESGIVHGLIPAETAALMRNRLTERLGIAARPRKPTFPHKDRDQAQVQACEPHLWQELHIPTGNPLVEHSQWWQCGEVE